MSNPLSLIQKSIERSKTSEEPDVGNVTGFASGLVQVSINGASTKNCVPPRDTTIQIGDLVAIFKPSSSENWYISNVYSRHRSGKPDAISSSVGTGRSPGFSYANTTTTTTLTSSDIGVDVDCSPILKLSCIGRPVLVVFNVAFIANTAASGNQAFFNLFIESDNDDSPQSSFRIRTYEASAFARSSASVSYIFEPSKGVRDFRLKVNLNSISMTSVNIIHQNSFCVEL